MTFGSWGRSIVTFWDLCLAEVVPYGGVVESAAEISPKDIEYLESHQPGRSSVELIVTGRSRIQNLRPCTPNPVWQDKRQRRRKNLSLKYDLNISDVLGPC